MSFRRQSRFSKYKAPLIICTGALLTGLISFFVTVKVYDNNFAKELNKELQNKVVTNLSGEKENIIAKIDDKINNEKPRNEVISEAVKTNKQNVEENKIDVIEIKEEEYNEFINMLAKNNEEVEVIETIANIEKESGDKKEENKLEFIMPISGEIGLNYATEKLIYSNTLEEWITHNGIDIIGEEAEPVKAIENGVVESVKMDPRFGNTIIIKHNDEYKSIYSNLSTTDLVYVGKKVEKGEIISGIGIGFGFESKEKPHVHLTILKNGESVNPIEVRNSDT